MQSTEGPGRMRQVGGSEVGESVFDSVKPSGTDVGWVDRYIDRASLRWMCFSFIFWRPSIRYRAKRDRSNKWDLLVVGSWDCPLHRARKIKGMVVC
ncbi:hypothetical protein AVEN_32747-1 [Araneus ventricosus]|uniref:Uncharacterized protein n=1 Tax=Araneus ventricosus TaxID=182803 RepID=A0A4Y2CUT8_ARAVE|nr:hypothetical protein AVEN_32747-1 [Araneus ventricosus]